MSQKTFKVIQISDFHLQQDAAATLFNQINTDATFLAVLDKVKAEKPDLILATGDLSQDGSIESYTRLKAYLSVVKCEVYTIYGNHDNPDNFNKILLGNHIKYVPFYQTYYGTFIFCNSFKKNYNTGLVSQNELDHIETCLKLHDNCIVVVHHHFVELGTMIDKYIMENGKMLLNLLIKYKYKIKLCITGHVHNSYDKVYQGINIHSSLSTCAQFAKDSKLSFDSKKPGYTVYNFSKDNYEILEKTI